MLAVAHIVESENVHTPHVISGKTKRGEEERQNETSNLDSWVGVAYCLFA